MSDITLLWSQITIFIIEITKTANLKVNDPPKFNIYMCEYLHFFAVYSDFINSGYCLYVRWVFGRTLVQESLYSLFTVLCHHLHIVVKKRNLRQYKFFVYYVFLLSRALVTLLYCNDLFRMHWMFRFDNKNEENLPAGWPRC